MAEFKPPRHRQKHSTQIKDDASNPCLQEMNQSYDCLKDNNYDKEKCEMYFANYKSCRGFWNKIIVERRYAGIKPHVPTPDERAVIIKDVKNKLEKQKEQLQQQLSEDG